MPRPGCSVVGWRYARRTVSGQATPAGGVPGTRVALSSGVMSCAAYSSGCGVSGVASAEKGPHAEEKKAHVDDDEEEDDEDDDEAPWVAVEEEAPAAAGSAVVRGGDDDSVRKPSQLAACRWRSARAASPCSG